jgi:hypothetical protein
MRIRESGIEMLKVTCIGRGRVPSTSRGQVGPSIRYSTADTSYHRLNMELDLLSLFGLHLYSCTPQPPPPRN